MYNVTAIDSNNEEIKNDRPIPEHKLNGLVQHLMSSPQVRDVHVEKMEDLSCLHYVVEDVVDAWVDMSIDECVDEIDKLILG